MIRTGVLSRLSSVALVVALIVSARTAAGAASTSMTQAYPILFNDHHVYARPDKLKAGRVLAALVRGATVLVPLRSMFEQMGGTVSYDATAKTVDVEKAGTSVHLTVGKAEVEINGETRALDVPPEIDGGVLLVPVRVISEALGAYVLWQPEKKLVVVRYIAPPEATPAPAPSVPVPVTTPPPTPAPTPSPSPTPAPKRQMVQAYAAADALLANKNYNEIAPGVTGSGSFDVKGALEIPLGPTGVMIGGDLRQFRYVHPSNLGFTPCVAANGTCTTVVGSDTNYRGGPCPNADPGCVTVIGHSAYEAALGSGQAYVPNFTAFDRDDDARIGVKVLSPRIYLAASYLWRNPDYLGYPNQHGIGFGLDKLPDLDQPFSIYGSVYYYPSVSGTYTGPTSIYLGALSGAQFTLQYRVLKYEIGLAYSIRGTPLFIEAGFLGDSGSQKQNTPASFTHNAIDVGGGLHL
jgi:hypothetical protein